jgi:hypothetical protein
MASRNNSQEIPTYGAWDVADSTPLRKDEAGISAFTTHAQRLRVDRAAIVAIRRKARSSVLLELDNLIGEEMTAKLVQAFGGTRLYIPHIPRDGDALTETIGLEAAVRLAEVYGGDRVDIPNPNPRRARIVELRSSGLSVDAIARALGCTRRRVFQVLAEARRTKQT